MFSDREYSKDTAIALKNAKKNFLKMADTIKKILEKNSDGNLDASYKKTSPDQILSQNYMNPETKDYLCAATMLSPNYWGDSMIVHRNKETGEEVVKPFNTVNWAQPFFFKSDVNETRFAKMGHFVFKVNTPICGLSQHIEEKNIFFSVSPNMGYLYNNPQGERTEAEYNKLINQLGRDYLTHIINHVALAHPNIKTSCVVLGNGPSNENMEAYGSDLVNSADEKREKIKHYLLPKESSKASVDVRVYNIDAVSHKINLTSVDLLTIFNLAENIKEKKEAMIVHCQQGLDRTGMFILAVVLYSKYQHYFCDKKCVDRIYLAYLNLQRSRGPTALTKVADFVNAIFLANTLNAIRLEKNSIAHLEQLKIEDEEMNNSKQILILKLKGASSTKEKFDLLENELKQFGMIPDNLSKNKKRHRSLGSTAKPPEKSADNFKKSNSFPGELPSYTENPGDLKSSKNANNFFPKKSVLPSISEDESSGDKRNFHMASPTLFNSKQSLDNLVKPYVKKLSLLFKVIQFEIEVEDALQSRIHPVEALSSENKQFKLV